MVINNKRGQQNIVSSIFIGIILFFILAIGINAFIVGGTSGFWSSLPSSTDTISTGVMGVLGPLFNVLLGLDGAGNNAFLMVLVFILISIIVVGTLDSVNVFGEAGQGKVINFLVGIIVSIIGVRFMPNDLWASLTAPSSAFVATVLVGLPFLAIFFLTMKMDSRYALARKGLWLFFVITSLYLIGKTAGDYVWIYLIFLIVAIVMLFGDSSVRKIFYKEKRKADIEAERADIDLEARQAIRDEIKLVQKIITNPDTPASDVTKAKRRLTKLRAKYGEASSTE
ncbi:hypothetical protein H8D91_02375 [archaeon]|nr:hypothetical protein [archaeon]